jgi:glutathionylspermidine synthase
VDLLVRYFPAEWLPNLPAATGWKSFLFGGRTPTCNPAYTIVTQSKRFPLVWGRLKTAMPTWRALLPETCSPHEVSGPLGDAWVLKPALGHEGKDVGISGVTDADDWLRIRHAAFKNPEEWVAQRRFQALPLATPDGPLYPCVGVYIIDGRAAGAYGRMALQPLIDDRSREVAVLVRASS